jgi:tripeptidyl-peptidase-1
VTPTIHLGKALRRRQIADPGLKSGKAVLYKSIEDVTEALGSSSRTDLSINSATNFLAKCAQFTTIDCLRALYNIPISNNSHPDNSFGIFEVAWVSWLPGDLDKFFCAFMPSLTGHRPSMELIDGGFWQNFVQAFPFNAEADVDMEYSMSLVYPQNVTNYQVGDELLAGTMNDLLAALDQSYCSALDPKIDAIYPDPHAGGYNLSDCGNHKPANVISVSYANDEVAYPPAYEQRQCLEYLKLGLQGITVIVSSADFGVAGHTNQCIDPTTGQANQSSTGYFNPTFPATCPYVTSVGGTQLPVNSSVSDPETAFYQSFAGEISTSGGGFSNVFPVPAYQSRTAREYLHKQRSHLSNISANFNSRGRGFPDVSANAANYVTAIDGKFVTVHGTSAAAPVFASVITKINDARLSMGKRPVGFLNPVLYANPHVMNDVVSGSNYGCGVKGFNAMEGWDPVTGLGTPDYKRMLDLYLELP